MSRIGSPVTMTVIAIVGIIGLLVDRRRDLVIIWIAAFAGGGILDGLLKSVVHRSRPVYGASFVQGQSFSFPSGHAMMSFIGMTMLIYVLIVTGRLGPGRGRVAAIAASSLFVLGVGISRIYLGVHYPSDVLGGYAAGAGWCAGCISVGALALHRRGRSVSSRRQVPESTL
jgi:undecaprenyl-diphosphatase